MRDWTVDPETWSFGLGWVPPEYNTGHLVESWEWVDGQTMIAHIHKGIHWHDKSPANGREFTAYDIQQHYDRVFGTGSGYTTPHPVLSAWGKPIEKATATDNYTVAFTFKNPTPFVNMLTILDVSSVNIIECPEVVKLGTNDWKNECGTGAFMVTDFIVNTSLTLSRNPNYWGYDERYPQNRLPYADEVKLMYIPDMATQIAALRTGRIDSVTDISRQQAESLARTSPELVQLTKPMGSYCIGFRCDMEPFTDINVRKAMQLAIDRQTIAKSYYGGLVDGKPAGLISPEYEGWCIPYDEWSQNLKDEYSYNPTKAKQLLATAGYPDGFKTNIISNTILDLQLLQVIKAYFLDIGVEMEIKVMENQAFYPYVGAKKYDQMTYADWSAKTTSPVQRVADLISGSTWNCGVNDPVYDAIYDSLTKASTVDEAKELASKADQYVLQNHWGVVVCPTVAYVVWQPYVKGYGGADIGANWIREWNLPRLWVDQALKKSMGR
jgi:peptide/nickel transport system substrate-binding protein